MKKGKFITFEGPDGCGKTTQIKLFAEYLTEKGIPFELTREPGGTVQGEEIRQLLLTGDKERWDGQAEILLFSAARRMHLTKKIWPALEKGITVISDRFADATRAYQGAGYGSGLIPMCKEVYQMIAGDFEPDLTFVLDLPVEEGLKRSRRLDNQELRFESMQLTFHQNLRKEYLKIAEENPARCVVVSAQGTPEEVQERIRVIYNQRMKEV